MALVPDAQPNQGDLSTEGLNARMKALAADNIFVTLIGVGLDFNTELVEAVSKVKGANYHSVHSPGEFAKRLNDNFDFTVTPLVFDLALKVDPSSLADGGEGWKILHVYGSPNPNDTALSSDGTLMKVNTLFPSPKTEEGIKGGVVLLRMRPPPAGANTPLQLSVTYTDRAGRAASSKRTVGLPSSSSGNGEGQYESSGVRKAVALARYVDLLKGWLLEEWQDIDKRPIPIPPDLCPIFPAEYCPLPRPELLTLYNVQPASGASSSSSSASGCTLGRWLPPPGGCLLPPPWPVLRPLLGRWERQSQKLAVGAGAEEAMAKFLPWFEGEAKSVGDEAMGQEAEILNKLVNL